MLVYTLKKMNGKYTKLVIVAFSGTWCRLSLLYHIFYIIFEFSNNKQNFFEFKK